MRGVRYAMGGDSMDAIMNAFQLIRVQLGQLGESMSWACGEEVGCIGITRPVPDFLGVAFRKRMDRVLDREVERFVAQLERRHERQERRRRKATPAASPATGGAVASGAATSTLASRASPRRRRGAQRKGPRR